MNGFYRTDQHFRLVNLGQTDIDIQNISLFVRLRNRLGDNIIHIVFNKCGFQLFLACGVYSFADNHGLFPNQRCFRVGSNHCKVFLLYRRNRYFFAFFGSSFYVLGSCSAAAADTVNTEFCNFFHIVGKFLCTDLIARYSVYTFGQACVWIYQNRRARILNSLFHVLKHFLRPESAVQANHIYAKSLKRKHCGFDICTRKKLTFFIEYH